MEDSLLDDLQMVEDIISTRNYGLISVRSFKDVVDDLKEIIPVYYRSIGVEPREILTDVVDNLGYLKLNLGRAAVPILDRYIFELKHCIRSSHGRHVNVLTQSVHRFVKVATMVKMRANNKIAPNMIFGFLTESLRCDGDSEKAVDFGLFYYGIMDWLRVIDGDEFQSSSGVVFIQNYFLPDLVSLNPYRFEVTYLGLCNTRHEKLRAIELFLSKGTSNGNYTESLPAVKAFIKLARESTFINAPSLETLNAEVHNIADILTN